MGKIKQTGKNQFEFNSPDLYRVVLKGYEKIYPFSNDIAIFKIKDPNNSSKFKYGYINLYGERINNHLYDYDSLCTYYSRIKQISKNLEFNRDIYKANIKYLDKNTFFDDREDLSFKSKKNIVDLLRMAFRCAKNFEIIFSLVQMVSQRGL